MFAEDEIIDWLIYKLQIIRNFRLKELKTGTQAFVIPEIIQSKI